MGEVPRRSGRGFGPGRGARASVGLGLAVALLAGAVAGCVTLTPPPPTTLSVSTTPALYPAFSPTVTDYVTRCDPSSPVTVSVGAPSDTTVAVDGQPATSGTFIVDVTLAVGQSFSFVVQPASQPATTYYVRCLPSDFPSWTSQTTGPTQAEYYLTVPIQGHDYPVFFDTDGVPIWWGPASTTPFATLLPNGDLAWTQATAPDEEHNFYGSLVRTITNTLGALNDIHDLLLLPNGDYVLVADTVRTGVDLTGIGGPSSASVSDPVVQEVAPGGSLVWSWDAYDHIPVTEMDPQWYSQYIANGCAPQPGSPLNACDVYHWNSIEYADNGSSFILSFRHLDAVYDISASSGAINWKLGGSTRPESLTVENDPVFSGGSHFGGQHDARQLTDGSGDVFVTLYDDGTNLGRPPRAVEYQLDTGAHTATLVDQASDPIVSASPCCGSARKLAGGDWVVGWGGTNTASELTSGGTRVFLLQFAPGVVLYRSVPISPGVLNRASLRGDMDAQYDTVSIQDHAASAPPSTPPKRRWP